MGFDMQKHDTSPNNLYTVLGVVTGTPIDAIDFYYKQQGGVLKKDSLLDKAYEILKDSTKRAAYDAGRIDEQGNPCEPPVIRLKNYAAGAGVYIPQSLTVDPRVYDLRRYKDVENFSVPVKKAPTKEEKLLPPTPPLAAPGMGSSIPMISAETPRAVTIPSYTAAAASSSATSLSPPSSLYYVAPMAPHSGMSGGSAPTMPISAAAPAGMAAAASAPMMAAVAPGASPAPAPATPIETPAAAKIRIMNTHYPEIATMSELVLRQQALNPNYKGRNTTLLAVFAHDPERYTGHIQVILHQLFNSTTRENFNGHLHHARVAAFQSGTLPQFDAVVGDSMRHFEMQQKQQAEAARKQSELAMMMRHREAIHREHLAELAKERFLTEQIILLQQQRALEAQIKFKKEQAASPWKHPAPATASTLAQFGSSTALCTYR
jgi:hypothetical protein